MFLIDTRPKKCEIRKKKKKKEIEPLLTDEKYKFDGIVSTKINVLMNHQLLTDAAA